ncbi:hypothetical protein [Hyphomonas sp.]|uniref:hypothetical protein n=1 Tax=Hyphomonas sp. TaxID=87 RepID=UPI00391931BF
MDQTAPPQTNLVAETQAMIGGLIEALAVMLDPGFVRPRNILTYLARAFLLPAEAALRRLIHLIAGSIAPLPISPRALLPRSAGEVTQRGGGGSPTRTPSRPPVFRLTEPLPRARNIDAPTKPQSETQTPRSPADPSAHEANLQRRFAALQAAFADPVCAARRLQRLAARLAPAAPVLSLEDIPGLASDIITDENRDTLQRLNLAVTRQRAKRLNTS